MRQRLCVLRLLAVAVLLLGFPAGEAAARDGADGRQGVEVGNPSLLRKLVPASRMEQMGATQYRQLTRRAQKAGRLLPARHPEVQRALRIARRLLPHASRFNKRAADWTWEVNVLKSNTINAFCMPGGKIALYTGLLQRLRLTDDEVAMIMGHEIAHALREHSRERMAKGVLSNVGAVALEMFTGSRAAGDLARAGGNLLNLKFSRDDETEADLIGMELAARGGFDPRAGITLWQKMSRAARGQPMEFLSTHPSGKRRIETIRENLPDVLPLYQAAR